MIPDARLIEAGTVAGPPRVLEAPFPAVSRRRGRVAFEKALDLLLACGTRRVRVVLGGTLPAGDAWLKAVEGAAERAAKGGKDLELVLRPQGALPDRVAARLAAVGGRVALGFEPGQGERLRKGLTTAADSGVPAFVEVPVAPADVVGLRARLEALNSLAPAKVRFAAAPGVMGAGRAMASLELGLSSWLEALARKRAGIEVLDFWEEMEPDLLAPDLMLTEEGGLSWATAARHAGRWPEFLKASPPVPVQGLKDLDALFMEPAARQAWAGRVLSDEGRDSWRDSVALSLRLWGFFQKPFPGFRDGSENKAIRRGLIGADLAGQDRFLRARLPEVGSVFLFLNTGCVNDCVFCKRKPYAPGRPLAEIEAALEGNARIRRKRIALVGNEPLLHPDVGAIVRLCRRHGFKEVEVMTSGTLLADQALARELKKAGVTAFAIPLCSARPCDHDSLTGRQGSFQETARGIENARSLGIKVFIHANLLKQNLAALAGLEKLAGRDWKAPFAVLPTRPKSPESMNLPYEDLEPSYEQMLAAKPGVSSLVGFPVCVQRRIQGLTGLGPEMLADSVKLYLLHQTFVKPVTCLKCPETRRCLGTFWKHLEAYPDDLPLLRLEASGG
ncbi:MAG: radical SAM protein [Elusimicrobia bacterium]|nr:radical SAM protein [Elusimicrobiota bacterium]